MKYLNVYSCPTFHGKHEKFGRTTFFRSDLRAKLIKLAKKMLFYCFQFCGLQMKSGNYLNVHSCPTFHGKHEKFGPTNFFRSDLRAKSKKTTLNSTLSAARAFILHPRVFCTQHAAPRISNRQCFPPHYHFIFNAHTHYTHSNSTRTHVVRLQNILEAHSRKTIALCCKAT